MPTAGDRHGYCLWGCVKSVWPANRLVRPVRSTLRTPQAPGRRIIITGAGPIGLLTAQTARAFGASWVAVSDINPNRLAFAQQFADEVIDVRERPVSVNGATYDTLIECSGSADAFADAVHAVSPGGIAVSVGMFPDGQISLPIGVLQTREIVLHGVFRYAHTYPTAIAMATARQVDLTSLITSRHGLEEVDAALRKPGEDIASIKPLVLPQLITSP